MTVRVRSHHDPPRYLKQHVAEILAASEHILEAHPGAPWRVTGDELVTLLARLHDTGKGTAAFQAYIAAPDRWRGDSREKAHTLPSLVLAVAWASARGVDAIALLSLALGVRGRHGAQPHDDETLHGPLLDDVWSEVLSAQLPTIDGASLGAEVSLDVPAVDDPDALIRRVRRALRAALTAWRAEALAAMVASRFVARGAYSVLLEADKAFLAVDRARVRDYLRRSRTALPTSLVDARCEALQHTPMDALRARARRAATEGFSREASSMLQTLTLPTGAGKTLLAATWALTQRARAEAAGEGTPTIILALPMLSIVEQTERVWRETLGVSDDEGDVLLPFHSLSERVYDPELDRGTEDFYLDTWRSEVVVTTFDQLLLAMYSDRAKHAMRYHRLLGACIVIDEAQYVPPSLWAAVSHGLRALADLGRTRVLAMSATPSPVIEGAVEVLDDPGALYADLHRYELHLRIEEVTEFEAFIAEVITRCRASLALGEGTLVTLNVRGTARETWERLDAEGLRPLLLSGDMTPAHRLSVIDAVRATPARVVVSTQCVEAGVDIDMHHVVRDLAPLDALVQIAGRCNRHALRATPGTVTVFHLKGARGRDDAADVYDPVALQCTREALAGVHTVPEAAVLPLCRAWYARLRDRKYTGEHHVERWAKIDGSLDAQRMLRGDDERMSVLVAERDPGAAAAILEALAIRDRWDRRNALRRLAPRIARESVAVSARVSKSLATRPVDAQGRWCELLPGQYHPTCGVDSRG